MENQKNSTSGDFKKSRRSLLIKSAKVAPIVTAMAAAPVWATNGAMSGNHSAGASQATTTTKKFHGKSCRKFARVKNRSGSYSTYKTFSNSSTTTSQTCDSSVSNPLPDDYYAVVFGGIGGVFIGSPLNATVDDVLESSKAPQQYPHVTELDRLMLAAYLNADVSYGDPDFPYSQYEVKKFHYSMSKGYISQTDAQKILSNLIEDDYGDFSAGTSQSC